MVCVSHMTAACCPHELTKMCKISPNAGADDAPSCSKQISAFDAAAAEFASAGVAVVGVRNEAGVKGTEARHRARRNRGRRNMEIKAGATTARAQMTRRK